MNTLLLSTPDIGSARLLESMAGSHNRCFVPVSAGAPKTGAETGGEESSELSESVNALHQSLLASAQIRWYQPAPPGLESGAGRDLSQQLDRLKVTLAAAEPWLIHEIQLSRFLPVWLSAIAKPNLIYLYSHPLECAALLQRRWRFPLAFGLALWECYVLAALRSLGGRTCCMLSTDQIRVAPLPAARQLGQGIGRADIDPQAELIDIDRLLAELPDQFPAELSGQVRPAQQTLFDALQSGSRASVETETLSDESQDILDYYGQLRAGFEEIKADRDHYRRLYRTRPMEQSNSTNLSTEPGDPGVSNDEAFCTVRVHIKGREVVEFIADENAPVLDTLRNCLARDSRLADEMVYLNYGESGSEGLYFMASSLVTLEITRATDR